MPQSTYVRLSVHPKMWSSLKAFEVKQSWRCSIPLIVAGVTNPKVGSLNSHCTYLWFITKCWEVSSTWVDASLFLPTSAARSEAGEHVSDSQDS